MKRSSERAQGRCYGTRFENSGNVVSYPLLRCGKLLGLFAVLFLAHNEECLNVGRLTKKTFSFRDWHLLTDEDPGALGLAAKKK
jgi:hypothetical protein